MASKYVEARVRALEREVKDLKRLVSGKPPRAGKSLYGILKGLEVSDEDIEEAKRSLFKGALDDKL